MPSPLTDDEAQPCPICGSKTDIDADCPGYGSPGNIMVCYPYCGNAIRFSCTNKECGWWYRYPNNRSAKGMGIMPPWNYHFMDILDDPPIRK